MDDPGLRSSGRTEHVSDDPPTDDTATENPPTDDTATENPPTDDTATENPPTDDTATENPPTDVVSLADDLADQLDADVLLYNGLLTIQEIHRLIDLCSARRRRPNVVLLLVTYGGDPNAAYRLATCLQANYSDFSLLVSGYCKSAGTLIAVGATELAISDHGELGPLDIQMSKEDEPWGQQSSLTIMDTLTSLQEKAYIAFEDFFLKIKTRSADGITVKTAAGVAAEITNGIFSSLYGQVDPLHIGEAGRAMRIAAFYGERLLRIGGNITVSDLSQLTFGYPSHDFVIDRKEAERLFAKVRPPTDIELDLIESLGPSSLLPMDLMLPSPARIDFLSTELSEEED